MTFPLGMPVARPKDVIVMRSTDTQETRLRSLKRRHKLESRESRLRITILAALNLLCGAPHKRLLVTMVLAVS
jgi:hypothetical protein